MNALPEFDEDNADVQVVTDPPFDAIPVAVTRHVRTKELPAKAVGILNFPLTTVPIRILSADHKRTRATIVGFTNDLILGTTAAQAASASSGGQWPKDAPLIWSGTEELWAASATSTATCTVIIDQWED